MRRYFFSEKVEVGQTIAIQDELFHHIFDVCRLQKGQHFELINNLGKAYLAQVESIEKHKGLVFIKEERILPKIKEPHLHLYLCFPKVSTFESVVEKSVELGIMSITPVLSDFSHIRSRTQFPTNKIPRWQKIVLQATQQSGRGDLLQIFDVKSLDEALQNAKETPNTLNVIAYEGTSPQSLKSFLSEKSNVQFQRINVFVGSEGGFSDSEVQKIQKLDLVPVTLGDQILRVETACLTLIASLKYEFDLLENQ